MIERDGLLKALAFALRKKEKERPSNSSNNLLGWVGGNDGFVESKAEE